MNRSFVHVLWATTILFGCHHAASNGGDGPDLNGVAVDAGSDVDDGGRENGGDDLGGLDAAPAADLSPPDFGPLPDQGDSPHPCGIGTIKQVWRAATQVSRSDGNVQLYSVSVGPGGDIWVSGSLRGQATFGEGTPYQQTLTGYDDILIARYAPDGTFRFGRVWWNRTSSRGPSSGGRIRALADGGAVVTADFYSGVTLDYGLPSEVSFTAAGGERDIDIVLARLAADGHVVWARHSGGGANDGAGIDALPDGRVVMAGRFADAWSHSITINLDRPDQKTLTADPAHWEELFIASYDADGGLSWVRMAGGTSRNDGAGGMVLLPDGSVVVSGSFTDNISFEGSPGSFAGMANVYSSFIARWSPNGAIAWVKTVDNAVGNAVVLGPNNSLWQLGHIGADDAMTRYSLDGSEQGSGHFASSNALHSLASLVVSGGVAYVAGDEAYDITLATKPSATTVSSLGWGDALALCDQPRRRGRLVAPRRKQAARLHLESGRRAQRRHHRHRPIRRRADVFAWDARGHHPAPRGPPRRDLHRPLRPVIMPSRIDTRKWSSVCMSRTELPSSTVRSWRCPGGFEDRPRWSS